jgi:hypothetical protein
MSLGRCYLRRVVSVISPHLLAADAAWDGGPGAGDWIAVRLAPFGPSVGHAVPLGYDAYAVVPMPMPLDDEDGDLHGQRVQMRVEALLAVLGPFTGDQPVHFGMWDGWAWWYDSGTDPRTADGMAVGLFWDEGDDPPSQVGIDRRLAVARERLAAQRIERPDAEPLDLPHRRYHLWTGPLGSALAFRHWPHQPPSLIWPEDRAWFVGVPIYTYEIAVAGPTVLIDAVFGDARLSARRATPDDILEGDD